MPTTFLCLLVLVNFTSNTKAKPVLLQPKDCQDILWSGSNISSVYTIYPQGTGGFKAYCDMKTAGGGWTVLQRRKNGKVGFNRYWKEYQYGFGDINAEHWIGNQRIHQLTSQGWYELRVDMSDFNNERRYAYYRIFSVGNKASGYKLTVGEYHGNAEIPFITCTGRNIDVFKRPITRRQQQQVKILCLCLSLHFPFKCTCYIFFENIMARRPNNPTVRRIYNIDNHTVGLTDCEKDIGDSLGSHNGSQFYSRDKDVNSCSKQFKGGWWYTNCHSANLNGLYLKGSHSSFADGINWFYWHGYHYSLKTTEMKIRRQ